MFKNILAILMVVIPGISTTSGQPSPNSGSLIKKTPNILFILVDDMGWNVLSCYGDSLVETPNIDRLARQGMKFTGAYAPSMCTPSRAEFFSGEYGAHTGITEQSSNRIYPYAPLITPKNNPNKLPAGNYTIGSMLHDAGYATMISGKWNIGDSYRVAGLKKQRGDQYFKPYGFDFIGDARDKDWGKVDKDKGDTAIVRDFFRFINHTGKRPFFAYLAFFATHTPIDAPDSIVNKFLARGFPKSDDRFGDATRKPTADFLAMVRYLDNCIGVLLDGLDRRGLTKNTMVVFMSDNGGMCRDWDNSPLRGAKGVFYEGGIRVPLLVRWPGHVAAGSQTSTPVDMVDIYPTLKEIAGGTVPRSKILDGVSLVPLLTQQGGPDRKALYWHRPQYIHDYGQTPNSTIRLGDYKLIHYYGDYLDTKGEVPKRKMPYGKLVVGERNELFNIKEDPGEHHDLSQKYPQKTRVLLDSLKRWLQRTNASVPVKNPDMDISEWYKTGRIKGSRETGKMKASQN